MVPMDIQAFVVQPGADTSALRKDLTDGIGMKSSTKSHGTFDQDTTGLDEGIHLHWSLPDALLVGQVDSQSNDGEYVFPPLPDRWLVVRQWPSSSGNNWNTKAWVVESSTRQVTPVEDWQSPGPSSINITAIDDGDSETEEDLAWLESYDGANGIFTFHDTPGAGVVGPLNYLIAGWYTQNSNDPLFADELTSESTWFDALDGLGWSVDTKDILTQVTRAEASSTAQEKPQSGGAEG